MPVSTSRRVPKFRPDEPDLARARGITPVGLAHDLILANGADRRIARPLVSKCSIGGNFRAPCDGGVSVQVSVIPRAREVRFVRLLRAESHPARCSGLLWLRLRSAQRMPTSVHLLCGFAGMTAALE